jgi:hypothetical protein
MSETEVKSEGELKRQLCYLTYPEMKIRYRTPEEIETVLDDAKKDFRINQNRQFIVELIKIADVPKDDKEKDDVIEVLVNQLNSLLATLEKWFGEP